MTEARVQRIHLITPYLDGNYYGRIFTAMQEQAAQRNIALYVIQTFTIDDTPTPFNYQAGSSAADGFLLTAHFERPLSDEYRQQLASYGKPIVTVGYADPLIPSYAVLPDNRSAAEQAVLHLIREHGHQRIAFVGNLELKDIAERFEGYKAALSACGLPFDPHLVFAAHNQEPSGGRTAAQAIVTSGVPFTAVFAGTDSNAIGMMERLRKDGIHVPDDVAVVAYDDIVASATSMPPLTTVRQSFEELARIGFDLLLRLIEDGDEPPQSRTIHYQPEFIVRQSCGCPEQPDAYAGIVEKLAAVQLDIEKLTVRQYLLSASWTSSMNRTEDAHFSNMYWKGGYWGCLALWDENDPDRRHLIIHQVFGRDGDQLPPIGLRVPIEQFPDSSWIPALGPNDYVRVQSIRNPRRDWGFIVIVVPMDDLALVTASDIMQHSFTFFASVLENDILTKQIRYLAYHDTLTGLPNRKQFHDYMADQMERASRDGDKIGILWIDLDRFKEVNDSLGHDAGDELLRNVAAILDLAVRDAAPDSGRVGMAARIGGDEFVMLLTGVSDPEDLKQAAQRIIHRLEEPFYVLEQHEVSVTASIGISVYPDDGTDLKELMRSADAAMYRVKNSGRNNVDYND